MPSTTTATAPTNPWDFSLALEFLHSGADPRSSLNDDAIFAFDEDSVNGFDTEKKQPAALGDFGKVWQFLGVPDTVPDSTAPTPIQAYELSKSDEYTSDGADVSAEEAGSLPTVTPMTKTQRKKARRKERKELETRLKKDATVSGSEADQVNKQTQAQVAQTAPVSKHNIQQNDTRSRLANHGSTAKQSFGKDSPMGPSATVNEAVNAVTRALAGIYQKDTPVTPSPKPRTISSQQTTNRTAAALSPALKKSTPTVQAGPRGQTAVPKRAPAPNLLPSSISPMVNGNRPATRNKLSGLPPVAATPPSTSAKILQPKPVIGPNTSRTSEQRNYDFLMKLMVDFYEDRKYLVSPMNLTTHNNDPAGIHVFVDASNIFIGFNDQLKFTRNISRYTHLPQADMSFDSLALLMERRRPVAKRALVGSTPRVAAFDKAKAVGYECCILEKVHKARELTDRQIYFKDLERRMNGRSPKVAPPCNAVDPMAGSPASKAAGYGSGSGSETNTPQFAKPAWVEQGVDEILHLKMMESLVDYDEPSTMVLATGDAAQAEYSGGFLKMAQRALMKGWNVELVTWSKGINSQYKALARNWGDKFKIIFLDVYAEDLLDLSDSDLE
ncbi:hypothetical protein PRZ48_011112 [Zasmidium cellare]|uniref:NYN domain-containing protein n=1 Tax=Zasmidium cellare TaxID=395010 RepID=A0ABR0EAI3_ZASCE|nr:hypothetical protein PRZ48_011112 [Zasmidium cellare]